MSDIAIRVENLSKRYEIGRAGTRHDTLRDALAGLFRREGRGRSEAFWALRDVSFEVKRGEVVGIIGRNGAGKSTLLKVLSQITEPTGGRAEIHGRVGSLLEVGTGFHPELTGRENIYLNGAILGMRREEIARKFDEIVAFSEIEKFLDTPVKRYSSGMYVRLAFAVAAHLEPEILLVDEVLAVGDAAFQKKALGKMGDVVHEGRTVLFVSHNMAAINQLCQRCLFVSQGAVIFDGLAEKTVQKYLNDSRITKGPMWGIRSNEELDREVEVTQVTSVPKAIFTGEPLTVDIEYLVKSQCSGLRFGISIENQLGQRISASYTGREGIESDDVIGINKAVIHFPVINLTPGEYYITVAIHDRSNENLVRIERIEVFEVIAKDVADSGYLIDQSSGIIWLDHKWTL